MRVEPRMKIELEMKMGSGILSACRRPSPCLQPNFSMLK